MSALSIVVLLPLVVGLPLCAWLGAREAPLRRALCAASAGAVALACFTLLAVQSGAVFDGRVLREGADWMPAIGLNARFRLDGLSLMFGWLISGIGVLVVVYAAWYLSPRDPAGKLYGLLMLFMAAMLGIVLSDNLLLLLVFWELTGISSFLLVGYWGHRAEARAGARMALTVTGGGGLVLLAGIVLIGQIAGTYELPLLFERAAQLRSHPLFPLATVLVLLGCFTKSAQWPFHFWLPDAMAAPTPVSAYLHSATMVKAGIFLLMRLYPLLGGPGLFEAVVASVGLFTMVFAAYVAVFRHDLKGLLAYSTISHLGLVTFLVGLATPLSAVAAVFHVLNHATFKASLFMTAGIIDHETGTRDMRRLAGLMKLMPWTATLAMIAAASMAGVPLANGFLSKEMFFAEAVGVRDDLAFGTLVPLAATLGGICSVAYSLRFIHDVFFNGEPTRLPKPDPHEPPWMMKAPVALLAVVCIAVGTLPALTFGPLVHVAATAVIGAAPPPYELAIWHGVNLPLVMSVVAIVGGVAMYFALQRRFDLHLHHPRGWTGRLVFTRLVDALFGLAGRLTRRVENGSLQRMAAWTVATAIGLGAFAWLGDGEAPAAGSRALLPAPPLAIALWALLLAGSGALVLTHHDRLRAVVLVGVVGLVASLTFLGLSAPDLALTQLSVEVVSTVLLLMGLALLPPTTPRESGVGRRLRDAALAIAGGGGVAWISWLVLTRDHDSIAWYFVTNSLPKGGGTNAVNVILVDFRGYDTFGEITVLGIAAIGVLALLDGFRVRRDAHDAARRAWSFAAQPLMLRVAARIVLPLALVTAAYVFWRGHNLPGGGFVAGLVTAIALALQYLANGQDRAEAALRSPGGARYARWIGSGLAIAGLTGIGAFAFGRPFLTSAHGHPAVPLLGEMPLASAALFDLGVYVTVVGATMLMLSVLGAVARDAPAGPPA